MTEKTTSFLAFSCPHFPLNDKEACGWLLEKIEEYDPDVIVHLGDGHEAISASRWPHEYDWTLSYEFKTHNEFLRTIRTVSPKSRKVFLRGNHDDNLLALNRINKQLRDLCDFRKHEPELEYWEQPSEYVYDREKGVFRLGQVTFAHGYENGVSSDEFQAINLGLPYGLFISGHTHRPVGVTQVRRTKAIPLPYWYANVGCLRDIEDVPWMARSRRFEWGQAVTIGTAGTWRYEKSLMPQKPQWDAETLIYKMYGE